jgi:hypothetical protein
MPNPSSLTHIYINSYRKFPSKRGLFLKVIFPVQRDHLHVETSLETLHFGTKKNELQFCELM